VAPLISDSTLASLEERLPQMRFTESHAMSKQAPGPKIEPAPGMNEKAVSVRAKDDLTEVKAKSSYLASHTFKKDTRALLSEIDKSENSVWVDIYS
jgi:hypothetical protein